jgi:hypothetical protein
MDMNSDQTPGRPDARHQPAGNGGLRPHWRAANSAYFALLADGGEQTAARGDIWTIRNRAPSCDEELLLAVVTAVDTDTATVVPLSTEVSRATEWDLDLPIQTLGYPAVAQAKLAGTITLDQLDQRLSALMPESRRDLKDLLDAAQAGQAIPPQQLPVGPWVLSEADHRLLERMRCAEALRSYLTPLDEDPVSEWYSLGTILARGSRATGIELAAIVEDPRWAEKLEVDELDPFAALPPRKMAQLLKTLRICWTERVRDAVYRLAVKYAPSDIPHEAVFGRRQGKRASRRRAARSSQQAGEQAASDYVNAVQRELDEP